jgi:hypothetical protein
VKPPLDKSHIITGPPGNFIVTDSQYEQPVPGGKCPVRREKNTNKNSKGANRTQTM